MDFFKTIGKPEIELFDMSMDPDEKENIASRESELTNIYLQKLKKKFIPILQDMHRIRAKKDIKRVSVTEEEKKILRALGYVQ